MNETLNAEDRRHVRTSAIASLAFVFTFLLGGVAWAGASAPPSRETKSVAVAAAAAATNGPAVEQNDPGCGCAEACLAR